MSKNYLDITKDISGNLKAFRQNQPDVMQAFSSLATAATKEGALSKKTKELIALALGVASRCDGCIGFHTKALVDLNATQAELEETLEPVHNLLRNNAVKARMVICRELLRERSQFFQSLRHFSSHEKDRSTTHLLGITAKV